MSPKRALSPSRVTSNDPIEKAKELLLELKEVKQARSGSSSGASSQPKRSFEVISYELGALIDSLAETLVKKESEVQGSKEKAIQAQEEAVSVQEKLRKVTKEMEEIVASAYEPSTVSDALAGAGQIAGAIKSAQAEVENVRALSTQLEVMTEKFKSVFQHDSELMKTLQQLERKALELDSVQIHYDGKDSFLIGEFNRISSKYSLKKRSQKAELPTEEELKVVTKTIDTAIAIRNELIDGLSNLIGIVLKQSLELVGAVNVENEELRISKEALETEKRDLTVDNQRIGVELASFRAENRELSEKLQGLQDELDQVNARIAAMEDEQALVLRAAEARAAEAARQLQDARDEVRVKQNEVDKLEARIKAKEEQDLSFAAELAQENETLESLNEQLTQARAELTASQAKVAELERKLQRANEAVKDQERTSVQLVEANATLRAQLGTKEAEMQALQERLAASEAAAQEANARANRYDAAARQSGEERNNAQRDLEGLQVSKQQADQANAVLQAQLAKLQADLEGVRGQLDESKAETTAAQDAARVAQAKSEQDEAARVAAEADKKAAEEASAALNAQLQTAQESTAAANLDKDDALRRAREEAKARKAAEQELAAQTVRAERAERDKAATEGEKDEELRIVRGENDELKARLEDAGAANEELKARFDAQAVAHAESDTKKETTIADLRRQLAALQAELAAEKEKVAQKERELDELGRQLAEAQIKSVEAQTEVEAKGQEIAVNAQAQRVKEAELADARDIIAQLEAELQRLQAAQNAGAVENQATIARLQQELAEKERQILDLQDQLKVLQDKNNDLNQEIERLKAENERLEEELDSSNQKFQFKEAELAAIKAQKEAAEEKVRKLEENLGRLQAENERLTQANEDQAQQLRELNATQIALTASEQDKAALQARVRELTEALATLKIQQDGAAEQSAREKAVLEQKIAALEKQLQTAKQQLAEKDEEIEALKQQLAELTDAIKVSLIIRINKALEALQQNDGAGRFIRPQSGLSASNYGFGSGLDEESETGEHAVSAPSSPRRSPSLVLEQEDDNESRLQALRAELQKARTQLDSRRHRSEESSTDGEEPQPISTERLIQIIRMVDRAELATKERSNEVLGRFQYENERLRGRLGQLNQEFDLFEQAKARLERDNQKLYANVEDLNADNNALKSIADRLRAKIDALNKQLQERAGETNLHFTLPAEAARNATVNPASQSLDALTVMMNNLSSEVGKIRGRLDGLTSRGFGVDISRGGASYAPASEAAAGAGGLGDGNAELNAIMRRIEGMFAGLTRSIHDLGPDRGRERGDEGRIPEGLRSTMGSSSDLTRNPDSGAAEEAQRAEGKRAEEEARARSEAERAREEARAREEDRARTEAETRARLETEARERAEAERAEAERAEAARRAQLQAANEAAMKRAVDIVFGSKDDANIYDAADRAAAEEKTRITALERGKRGDRMLSDDKLGFKEDPIVGMKNSLLEAAIRGLGKIQISGLDGYRPVDPYFDKLVKAHSAEQKLEIIEGKRGENRGKIDTRLLSNAQVISILALFNTIGGIDENKDDLVGIIRNSTKEEGRHEARKYLEKCIGTLEDQGIKLKNGEQVNNIDDLVSVLKKLKPGKNPSHASAAGIDGAAAGISGADVGGGVAHL